MTEKIKYFICYAHEDKADRNAFLKRLNPLLGMSADYEFEPWSDDHIILGSNWRRQIDAAIDQCTFGLLLISPDFFGSRFIKEVELPKFVSPDPFTPATGKLVAPVVLKSIPLGDRVDLRGLEHRQLFFDEAGRSFEDCGGPKQKGAFVRALFEKILKMLGSRPETSTTSDAGRSNPGSSGAEHQAAHRAKYKGMLVEAMKAATGPSVHALARVLNSHPTGTEDNLDHISETLSTFLLDHSYSGTMESLCREHGRLTRKANIGGQDADLRRLIFQLSHILAPALEEFSVIDGAVNGPKPVGLSLVKLPANLRTTAEVMMAALDRREARFRSRKSEHGFPEGHLVVPLPPEEGMNFHVEKAADAVRRHLEAKMHPGMTDDFIKDINGYLYTRFVERDPGAPPHDEGMQKSLAKDEMSVKISLDGATFYILFHPPSDDIELSAMNLIAERINKYFPMLPCLVLRKDDDRERSERMRYFFLRNMIPIKGIPSS